MIIGICGWIGAGKDTVADYLVSEKDYSRDSFAGPLKDAVSAVFGWERELLEGRTKAAREWREQVDEWWATRLNMPNLTPRLVLQQWGTEVCRESFHDDIWIASLENKLRSTDNNIVISDCRFPNEITAIKQAGGRVIWVRRGDWPEWYDDAVAATKQHATNEDLEKMRKWNIHASEWAWINSDFDAVLENTGTIEELYTLVDDFLSQKY